MRKLLLPLLVAAMLLCVACEGPEGLMGPAGEQGEIGTSGQDGTDGTNGQDGTDGQDGEPGTPGQDGQDGEDGAGTRVVYTSSSPVPSHAEVYYLIPEITLTNMPLVAVYAAHKDWPDNWWELSVYFDIPAYSMYYYIEDGRVYVGNCMDNWIRIVVVT